DSPDHANTWAFLDRRIEDVMRFETVKAKVNNNPLFKPFLAGPKMILDRIKAPSRTPRADMPGHFTTPANQESK
ncbi:MAG: COQ9 family protein, partial [Pseudomonadota bacterium]|nr:COQ9 family protein [Pseudomonadota bacterium]